jgi:hypothetical protein
MIGLGTALISCYVRSPRSSWGWLVALLPLHTPLLIITTAQMLTSIQPELFLSFAFLHSLKLPRAEQECHAGVGH